MTVTDWLHWFSVRMLACGYVALKEEYPDYKRSQSHRHKVARSAGANGHDFSSDAQFIDQLAYFGTEPSCESAPPKMTANIFPNGSPKIDIFRRASTTFRAHETTALG